MYKVVRRYREGSEWNEGVSSIHYHTVPEKMIVVLMPGMRDTVVKTGLTNLEALDLCIKLNKARSRFDG